MASSLKVSTVNVCMSRKEGRDYIGEASDGQQVLDALEACILPCLECNDFRNQTVT